MRFKLVKNPDGGAYLRRVTEDKTTNKQGKDTVKTYTIATRNAAGQPFVPVKGIPTNMTKLQAETLALQARDNGFDAVAFNVNAS